MGGDRKAARLVRRLVKHHFGSKPFRVVCQPGGLTNLVFTVHHPEGDLIVRVSPEAEKISTFMKEQWAITKARKSGVPVPDVLEVDNEVIPMPYMIARKSKGREAALHPERLKIVREMGHHAAIINRIPTSGFGATFELSKNQLSRNATWREFLKNELKLEECLHSLKSSGILAPRTIKALRTTLERAAGEGRRPALNHGDLRLKNVLVDEKGKIVCILDWEHCASNLAPEWEMSLALHDLSIDEKQEFIEGYGLDGDRFSAIARVVKAINLVNYAHMVEKNVHKNETAQLDRYRMRFQGHLDLFCFG